MENKKFVIEKKFITDFTFKDGILTLTIKKNRIIMGCSYFDSYFDAGKQEYKLASNLLFFVLRPISYFVTDEQHKNPKNIEKILAIFDFVKNMDFEEFKEKNEINVEFDFKYLFERSENYKFLLEKFAEFGDGTFFDKNQFKTKTYVNNL